MGLLLEWHNPREDGRRQYVRAIPSQMGKTRSLKPRNAPRASWDPDAVRLGLLFVPLLFQIAVLRLLETTMLRRGALASVDTLLWTSGPLPFLNVLIGIAVYWYARGRTGHLPAIVATTVATGATAVSATLSFTFAPWWISGWVTPAAIELLRFDLLLILGIVSLGLLLLSLGGRTAAVARRSVHILVPFVAMLSGSGFGYFLATGSPADWQLLKYAVGNVGTLRELLAGSVRSQHLALLAVPWLWSGAVWLVMRRRAPTRTGRTQPSAALSLAPVMLLLALAPRVDVAPSVQSGSLHRIVRMAAADIAGVHEKEPQIPVVDGAPDFDARFLTLNRTDSTRTPNIVVILMESVRSRSATPYNPGLPTMPYLDSLASRGALIENMYAVVSYTNKSLVPLYAGIYPRPGRDVVEATRDAIPARGLPDVLRPLGYRSAFFTSATMDFERKDIVLENLGFDHTVGAEDLSTSGFYRKAYFGFEDRAALEPALDWARRTASEGHPYFLSLLTLTSHHPYDIPGDFERRDYGVDDPELNAYYNSLRYTDDFVRDFVGGIERLGAGPNTVFIILGDHGEAFREHLERTHGNVVWDEALQVPAVLYAPGLIAPGTRITGPRQHIDFVPTLAGLLKANLTGGSIPGRSLLGPVPADRTLYHHSLDDGKVMALRRDSLKFMYYYKHAPTRVFNYITDPEERLDISTRFSAKELSAVELELLLWRKRVTRAYPDRRRVRLYPKTLADSSHSAGRSVRSP